MNADSTILMHLKATLAQFSTAANAYLPTLLTALVALLVGVGVAWVVRAMLLRIADSLVDMLKRRGVEEVIGSRHQWPVGTLTANAAFWIIVMVSGAVFMRMLGLGDAAIWLAAGARFLPAVTGAAAILIVGYIAASALSEMARRTLSRSADPNLPVVVARLAFVLINLVAILAALRQLGIDLILIRTMLIVAGSAFLGAIALSFALGARSSVANLVAAHYVRGHCQRGQYIKIGAVEGEILDVSTTTVVLDTAKGRVLIPANHFNQEVVTVTGTEDLADER